VNRILFERGEIADGIATCGGVRAKHILDVLHGEVGQALKTGEVDGLVGTGEIVEKDIWGATLLKEENYRPLLVDGMMQSGTSALPRIETRRNFRAFVRDELDAAFPTANRVVAHPYGASARGASAEEGRLLLAVGPEGGWTDEEVELLESRGFARYSLGRRILRTDTALVALVSRLCLD
jgi:16S rRNA U1498 N3-methylase RsmE